MALTGTYTKYLYEDHPTETVDNLISYPSDLSEDHPFYDKRGTTETISVPFQVETTQIYENCYIMVRAASIYPILFTSDEKHLELAGFWRLYESQAARNADPNNYIEENYFNKSFSFDEGSNPFDVAYQYIQSLKGSEELTSI